MQDSIPSQTVQSPYMNNEFQLLLVYRQYKLLLVIANSQCVQNFYLHNDKQFVTLVLEVESWI